MPVRITNDPEATPRRLTHDPSAPAVRVSHTAVGEAEEPEPVERTTFDCAGIAPYITEAPFASCYPHPNPSTIWVSTASTVLSVPGVYGPSTLRLRYCGGSAVMNINGVDTPIPEAGWTSGVLFETAVPEGGPFTVGVHHVLAADGYGMAFGISEFTAQMEATPEAETGGGSIRLTSDPDADPIRLTNTGD